MCLISIIIPVYNVEKYLERCLESIIAQNFDDYEIILVNDGSTDKSLEICKNYEEKHDFVKVIDQLNKGQSEARNVGIKKSIGEYLMFVDSDDYWDNSKSLFSIKESLQNSKTELLIYGYKQQYQDENIIKDKLKFTSGDLDYFSKYSNKEFITYLIENNRFPLSAWSTIINKDFLIKNNLFFQKGLIAEDVDWKIKIWQVVRDVNLIEDLFYVYIVGRKNSLSNSSGVKGIESMLYIIEKWVPIFYQNNNPLNQSIIKFLSYQYSTLFITFAYINAENKTSLKPRLSNHFYLLDNIKSLKVQIIKLIIQLFGFDVGSKMIRSLYKYYIRS